MDLGSGAGARGAAGVERERGVAEEEEVRLSLRIAKVIPPLHIRSCALAAALRGAVGRGERRAGPRQEAGAEFEEGSSVLSPAVGGVSAQVCRCAPLLDAANRLWLRAALLQAGRG